MLGVWNTRRIRSTSGNAQPGLLPRGHAITYGRTQHAPKLIVTAPTEPPKLVQPDAEHEADQADRQATHIIPCGDIGNTQQAAGSGPQKWKDPATEQPSGCVTPRGPPPPLCPPEGAAAACPPRRRVVQRLLRHRNEVQLRWRGDSDEIVFGDMESEGTSDEDSATSEAEDLYADAALDSVPPRDAPSPPCAHPHPSPPSPARETCPYGTEQEDGECGSPLAPLAPAPSPPPEEWSPPPAPRRCSPSPLRAVVPSVRRMLALGDPLFGSQAQEAEAPLPSEQALGCGLIEAVSPSPPRQEPPSAEPFRTCVAMDHGTEPVPSDRPPGGKLFTVPPLRKPKERKPKGGCCTIS